MDWMGFLQNFLVLFLELTALFIVISFLVSLLQQVVTEEKIKSILQKGNKATGYISGTLLGALTPFCSCSTIPILAGLLSSGAPFGPSISFLISSPLLNPVIVILLWKLLGFKLTAFYVISMFIFAVLAGLIFNTLGLEKHLRNVKIRRSQNGEGQKESKWIIALKDAWSFFYPVLPYLLFGVLIGAVIHDFIPADFISSIAGKDHPFAIPVAAIIGIPMYIRVETMIPISEALVSKGMSMGAVIALIIGGAGASLPEVLLLNKLFKPRLLTAFIVSILIGATVTGYILYFTF
ncbi:permease [Virgibacillus pantothenticus]|uniref:permease n=1 Tax=Virgibacillus pantothenticus TaxID=1473 RepID=UPI001C224358|nr:permease [Virgibacillus pantothenticus]MBU8567138.1 permease [Virgibacillus pantothenticus]MBU8600830.1 permease [Virgibacillus pantothenticus]MBU8635290.1 permease [Virgibacillus pantothenticus]MBU8642990.1 permease [Virgibacillus pantothenticus]MBU8646990.1 permease [Virgibacillus pantothenticus]